MFDVCTIYMQVFLLMYCMQVSPSEEGSAGLKDGGCCAGQTDSDDPQIVRSIC